MVRIQLASNFQVVELNYNNWSEVDYDEVSQATELVNNLGKSVINEIKTKPQPKEEFKPASEKQIKYAIGLGLSEDKARTMSSKEVWTWIQNNK